MTSTHSRTTRTAAVAVGALVAALATGCGSDDKSKPAAAAAAPTSTPGLASLYGTYERKTTKSDIARTKSFRHEGPGQSAPKPGPARLVISSAKPQDSMEVTDVNDDNFTFGMDIKAAASGVIAITSYTTPAHGAFCGPETSASARYSWKVSGKALVLDSKSDPCADRDSTLTGRWTRR